MLKKLYYKQWVIGLVRGNIKDIIRTKTFNQDIQWLPTTAVDHFYADPFLLKTKDGNLNILYEDFSMNDYYGNISLMTLDRNLSQVDQKVLLDTKGHLSYPFVFQENDKIYVFPESAKNNRLACYEYDPIKRSVNFLQDIIDLPLYDSTILKYNNKYWLFGTINENRAGYKLYLFFSDNLLGPYYSHHGNPVKDGLNGTRSAGNFIEVDGTIYRPTQNCEGMYGESITINKIISLNEHTFIEEPYMKVSIDKRNNQVHGIHEMHTINYLDDLIVVDGMKWTFSLKNQWENFTRNRRLLRQFKEAKKHNSIGQYSAGSDKKND